MQLRRAQVLVAVFLLAFFASGCAAGIKLLKINQQKQQEIALAVKAPEKIFRIGEKLTYGASWNGLYVGKLTMTIKEKVSINGKEAYCVVANADSASVLDAIFKVRDTYTSFIDAQDFRSLKFERKINERFYTAHEATEYDQEKHSAVITNLRNNENKTIEVPANIQDMVSCLFYFRTLELKPGDDVKMDVNIRSKIYTLAGKVLGFDNITIPKLGNFDAFRIEPKASFKGILIDRGKGYIWVSTDERRLPLVAKMKIMPFGSIVCTLEKVE